MIELLIRNTSPCSKLEQTFSTIEVLKVVIYFNLHCWGNLVKEKLFKKTSLLKGARSIDIFITSFSCRKFSFNVTFTYPRSVPQLQQNTRVINLKIAERMWIWNVLEWNFYYSNTIVNQFTLKLLRQWLLETRYQRNRTGGERLVEWERLWYLPRWSTMTYKGKYSSPNFTRTQTKSKILGNESTKSIFVGKGGWYSLQTL